MRTHDREESRKSPKRPHENKRGAPRFEARNRYEEVGSRRVLPDYEEKFEEGFGEDVERDWESGRDYEEEGGWRGERLGRGDRDEERLRSRGRSRGRLVSEYEDEGVGTDRDEWGDEIRQNRERGRFVREDEDYEFRYGRGGWGDEASEPRNVADRERDRSGRFAGAGEYGERERRNPNRTATSRGSGRALRGAEGTRRSAVSVQPKKPASPSPRRKSRESEEPPRETAKRISHGRRVESGGRSQNKRGRQGRSRSSLH